MVELAKRGASLNSLWSLVYCFLVLAVHSYITYLGISKYRKFNDDVIWGGATPSELRTYIALIVLAILFLPLFVFTSVLKVGNIANDGTKLGRDHALNGTTNTIATRIRNAHLHTLWQQFPPFSPVFHLLAAFLVLIPEVVLTSAEVKHGITPSDAVWSCDLDFLFDNERVGLSSIISQSNITVRANASFYVVPTPKPPIGGWTRTSSYHAAFGYMAAGLFAFTVRYASVFWFTNKIFGLIFTVQMLFMSFESLFAFCGVSVLYKLSGNYEKYQDNVDIILGPTAVMVLYTLSGIILIFATLFVFNYGSNYFQEKFKIIDKRHHPETYRKQTITVQGTCQGYKTHTCAMISLVLLAAFRAPILYDLVSLYKVTKDSMVLTCIIIDVCYMVFWAVLWTVLTLKQQWQFRILDYVPLNQPVFMISNDNIVKSVSYHGGSLEIHEQCQKKRPSSLPSDVTASESGFGDANSSEDERERFELSLPPLEEVPNLISSRKKGSTHSLDRRSRGRRNGHQRVTFHDTVKRSTSTDNEMFPSRRVVSTAADVHRQRSGACGARDGTDRSSTPVEMEMLRGRKPSTRHSIETAAPVTEATRLNNVFYKQNPSDCHRGATGATHDKVKDTNTTDQAFNYRDYTIKNNYADCTKSNLKSSNIQTQTNLNNANNNRLPFSNSHTSESQIKDASSRKTESCVPQNNHNNDTALGRTHLSPRSIALLDKPHGVGLSRRDSANYSLTSSQETTSSDSDHTQHSLCSQV